MLMPFGQTHDYALIVKLSGDCNALTFQVVYVNEITSVMMY